MINAIEETVSTSATHRQAMAIPYTKEDRNLQRAWPGIRFKSPSGSLVLKKKKVAEMKVVWKVPTEGWVKENFDGAASSNPGLSGIGVILRDFNGNILLQGAKKLPRGTNNIAECNAALLAVRIAKREGVKKLHL